MNATSWPPEKRFLRDTETAAWYGVSIDKLRWDRCHAKRVPFVKVDGRVFYDTLVVGPIIAECFGVPVRPLQYAPSAPSRTVAIAQEAARRLEQPGHCAGYLQTALAGADRVKLGAAVALLVRGGSPEVMRMAQRHLVDAVQRVALTEAADEQRPGVAA